MPFLEVLFYFLGAFAIALLCGYGLAVLLLPERYLPYSVMVSPSIGYCLLSGLSYIVSGTFRLAGGTAVWIAFAILATVTAIGACKTRRQGGRQILARLGHTVLLSSTMLLVILWPLFYVGVTYLSAVNPDYFVGFQDNHYLRNFPVLQIAPDHFDSYSPFFSSVGGMAPSARFASGLFALFLEESLGCSARTAFTISIGFFIYCLPLSVYFMARVVFEASERVATLSSLLIGISGPIAMSFTHFYLGQNSGLSITPLMLSVFYIVLTHPSIRIMILAAMLTSSFFFVYLAMLPYACAPVGLLFPYLLWKHRLRLRTVCLQLLVFGTWFGGLGIALARDLGPTLAGWKDLLGRTIQAPYFAAFLTEEFVPTFLGLGIYPLGASPFVAGLMPYGRPLLLAAAAAIVVWLLIAGVAWARGVADKARVVYVVGAIAIYTAVWWLYTFPRQHGYFIFKMSSWLQFLLAIGYSVALHWSWAAATHVKRRSVRVMAVAGCCCLTVLIVGGNLVASIQYGLQGLGTHPERGAIVNSFGISGNYDYLAMEPALSGIVKPGQSVGLALPDSIQNNWTSYYLRNFRLSWLSHYRYPQDDENLPDIFTRRTTDIYGNLDVDANMMFHGATDDYILTIVPENTLATDIIEQSLPKPLWKSKTFELLRAADVPDFLFTGRGFYRLEIFPNPRQYWWPARMRWTSEGGEIYLLHRPQESGSYRLSFLVMVGYGIPSARRTLEFWHNKQKIDEIEVNGTARVVTRPFSPVTGVNLLVIKAKENVRPLPRRLSLWNKDIPLDYRALNFGMSSVRLLRSGQADKVEAGSAVIRGMDLLSSAVAFNGLEGNGWVREAATLSYMRPWGSSAVDIEVFVPDSYTRRGPCPIVFGVDGTSRRIDVARPGPLRVSLPLGPSSPASVTSIAIKPCAAFYADGYDHRIRAAVQSVQIQEIRFKQERSFQSIATGTELKPPYAELRPAGIDPDGWFLDSAALTIPVGAKEMEMEFELPQWAGVAHSSLWVSLNERPLLRRLLRPGIETLRIVVTDPGANSTLKVQSDRSFPLPKPDERHRSLRLRSVRAIL